MSLSSLYVSLFSLCLSLLCMSLSSLFLALLSVCLSSLYVSSLYLSLSLLCVSHSFSLHISLPVTLPHFLSLYVAFLQYSFPLTKSLASIRDVFVGQRGISKVFSLLNQEPSSTLRMHVLMLFHRLSFYDDLATKLRENGVITLFVELLRSSSSDADTMLSLTALGNLASDGLPPLCTFVSALSLSLSLSLSLLHQSLSLSCLSLSVSISLTNS